jgi:hypothetical protein
MYIGTKSSDEEPYCVIGKKYFSSSSDDDFIKEQKEYPENFRYKVLKNFDNRTDAIQLECYLHKKYNVVESDKFYNRSAQLCTSFDITGLKLGSEFSPTYGRKRTDEERKHISEGTIKAMKLYNCGEHISEKMKQHYRDHPEARAEISKRMSKASKEMWKDPEYRKKMSEITSERNRTREITDHMRKRSSESRKLEAQECRGAYRKVECPYCKRKISLGNYSQFHGDNCKMKNSFIIPIEYW